jgi:uncharacterized protein YukE
MATQATIWFNYQQAIQQAEAVARIATDLKKLSTNDLEDALDQVSASWQGENANRYHAKGSELQQQVAETARTLQSISSEIRDIAKRIYNAEMANLEIAKTRTSGSW